MVNAKEFRRRARNSLSNNYGMSILVCLIYTIILGSSATATLTVAAIILSGALSVGMSLYFLNAADGKEPDISDLFSQFNGKAFGNTLVMYILTCVYTFLWSLLFIIPGIIAALSYALAPYILAEHPEISASEALRMSKEMMQGNKGRLFCLQLSFIGWGILSIFTFGIGLFFLMPYMQAANAEFFNEISGKNYEKSLGQNNPEQ